VGWRGNPHRVHHAGQWRLRAGFGELARIFAEF